ncbi:cytochrome c3 family protein [Rhodoferax sp.]|uniref:cytochrome c3 family protein n=1 Tax=Rhodoferax sp. TaxID=50421 RepID=UPI002605D301|nr:cytochrome c3 family protein [Rhodoferax sp.]MDD2918861.1 cytochrome c3 family protein [Rhodoferax sp.]
MKVLKSALAVSMVLATMGTAMASTGGTGITGTRHDYATRTNYLGSQTGGRAGLANSAGQCMYCHTPHSATTTNLLWNKELGNTSYTWDISLTDGGTTFATLAAGYKGPSVKCLACHDGAVAIGDVALARGSLNATLNSFKVGDIPTSYSTTISTATFTSTAQRPQFIIGSAGSLAGTHPIGMPYPLANAVGTYNGVTTGGSVVLNEFQANPHQISSGSAGGGLAVSASYPAANGAGNQAALIKLYQDNGTNISAGTSAGLTGMECSTCHDPHNKQTVDDWMLRGTNNGSTQASGYICLQCHIK